MINIKISRFPPASLKVLHAFSLGGTNKMNNDAIIHALKYLLSKQNEKQITIKDHELLNFHPQKYSIIAEYDPLTRKTTIKLKETP